MKLLTNKGEKMIKAIITIVLLLFSITVSAGQFITENDLIRANDNNPPYTLHQKTLEKCELLENKKCYDVTGLELEYHRINMFGFVIEDSGLKSIYESKKIVKQQKAQETVDRNKRLKISLASFSTLNQLQKDNLLKDLLTEVVRE